MNEEIRCITNEGKTAKNELEKDSDFLPALYIVYKKLGQSFFHTLLANLFKQRYISSVNIQFNKCSIKTFVLGFLKILCICA